MDKHFDTLADLFANWQEAQHPELEESYKAQIMSELRLIKLDGQWTGLEIGRNIAMDAINAINARPLKP